MISIEKLEKKEFQNFITPKLFKILTQYNFIESHFQFIMVSLFFFLLIKMNREITKTKKEIGMSQFYRDACILFASGCVCTLIHYFEVAPQWLPTRHSWDGYHEVQN